MTFAKLPPPLTLQVALAPSRAFGDGSHDTTALCLQAVWTLSPRGRPWSMLDFGAGTGVLAIVAAKLGAVAHGVEIDEASLANATENIALNDVSVSFAKELPANAKYDVVVANILRGILLRFCSPLVACLAPGGTLVLSGLTSTDVPEVGAAYSRLLGGARPEVYSRGEWRALVWRSAAARGGRDDDAACGRA